MERERRRVWVSVLVAAALLVAQVAVAGDILTTEEIRCRSVLGSSVQRILRFVLSQKRVCHELRLRERVDASVDCGNVEDLPRYDIIERVQDRLLERVALHCADAPEAIPTDVLCPSPCDFIYVSDVDSYGHCLSCRIDGWTRDVVERVFGTYPEPTIDPDDRDGQRCLKLMARSLERYAAIEIKLQQICQKRQDRGLLFGVNCRFSDVFGLRSRLLLLVDRLVSRCSDTVLQQLSSCADDVDGAKSCVVAAGQDLADESFQAVYEPITAVYVSDTYGTSTGEGTAADPVATINGGIQKAYDLGATNVLIEGGVYNETVILESNINLIGGYSADTNGNWVRDGAYTKVFGGSRAVLGSFVWDVVIDGITIAATDAGGANHSSYGVLLIDPWNVMLRDVRIYAGGGAGGSDGNIGPTAAGGDSGAPGDDGCESGANGFGTTCGSCPRPDGGEGAINTSCPIGTAGGDGGTGSHCSFGRGTDGDDGSGGGGGAGGDNGGALCDGTLYSGDRGEDGDPGEDGGNGIGGAGIGGIGNVYVPARGGNGSDGENGSGGGGGGGGGADKASFAECYSYGGGGGGGGAGGCGGEAGTGGGGGGGSFGLWVSGGFVSLVNAEIFTGAGGNGGRGGFGKQGGIGGEGGGGGLGFAPGLVGTYSEPGGDGGRGGDGGHGGHGGGGGGGPSVGVVCAQDALVSRVSVGYDIGSAGKGGDSDGNPGADGIAQQELECNL